jgi:peptidyl-prolyl cis-trans isomerase-like 3
LRSRAEVLLITLTGRTAENFLARCAEGYYNNNLFHRNIKGFIVQTGDPTNTGKGGESIYGGIRIPVKPEGYFEDEIVPSLKMNARGMVAMVNRGPGTKVLITR